MPTFNQFLRPSVNGENVRDFAHASRTFVDGGTYRLAPKQKFLFYVVFNLNPIRTRLSNLEKREVSALVKSASLPNFSIDTADLNQYNRHKYIQTKINYQPVNIKFHDDSNNLINRLWIDYYSYYYADTLYPENEYYYGPEVQSTDRGHIRWGLDNGSVDPFFNSIKIYSLHQQKFTEYTLINPIIKSFNHDGHDYSEGAGVLENSMDIEYEAVKYATGSVNAIKGFGELHYDTRPSPLKPNITINTTENIIDLASESLIGADVSGSQLYNNASNSNMRNQTPEQLVPISSEIARGQNPTTNFAFPVANSPTKPATPNNTIATYAAAAINSSLATSNGSGLAVSSRVTRTTTTTTVTVGGANAGLRPTRLVGGKPTLNTKR